MCGGRPSAPPPPPPPPPPAPAAPPAPKLNAADNRDDPGMDKSINQINRKGRSRLRIDPAAGNVASEGSGLNIPQ